MLHKKFDFYLFLPIVFLLGLSIAIVVSVSPESLLNHLSFIALGLSFFFLFSFLDLEILFPLTPLIYVAGLLFLVLPFLVGTVTRGSLRWIPLAGYTIQPSEIVKPFLALAAAWFWAKREFNLRAFFSFSLLFLPVLALIFLQPDLGSTLVVLSIFAGLIGLSGIKLKQALFLLGAALLFIPLLWFSLRDYQRMRVIHFVSPYADPLGEGYNLIQAKIAVGSGGLFGRGLGRGTQSHLAFLPEKQTDFVFASLAEELGLAGTFLVLFLYLLLYLRILRIASRLKDRSHFLLSLGLFFHLAFQTVVNIGMNIGLLPITGVTLPLISCGGSSLLATLISLGILEALSRERSEEGIIEIK